MSAGDVLVETVRELAGIAVNVLECLAPWSIACKQNVQAVTDFAQAIVDDPVGVLGAMWDGIVQPIEDDWNNGNYGEAIGRGAASVAEVVAGAKGLSKLRVLRFKPRGGSAPIEVAAKTGTVWDDIGATQGSYPGSELPGPSNWQSGIRRYGFTETQRRKWRSICLVLRNSGATKAQIDSATQALLSSLQAAVSEASQGGLVYNQILDVGGWELKFGAPRYPGQVPALFHAVYGR